MNDTAQKIAAEAASDWVYKVHAWRGRSPAFMQTQKNRLTAIIQSTIEKSTEPELYDQRKWIAQHNTADEHIYDRIGKTVAKAVYYSPAYRESRAAQASKEKQ